jgi:hypothetical protein
MKIANKLAGRGNRTSKHANAEAPRRMRGFRYCKGSNWVPVYGQARRRQLLWGQVMPTEVVSPSKEDLMGRLG